MEKGLSFQKTCHWCLIKQSKELIYYLSMYTYFSDYSFLKRKTSINSWPLTTWPNITDVMDIETITEMSPWGRTLRNPPQCGCVQVNMQIQHSLAPLILSLVNWYIYIYISIYFFLNPLTDCLSNPPLKTWVVFFSTEIHLIHKIILCMFFYMSVFIRFFVCLYRGVRFRYKKVLESSFSSVVIALT